MAFPRSHLEKLTVGPPVFLKLKDQFLTLYSWPYLLCYLGPLPLEPPQAH